jgi:hypothetical protein
MATLIIVAVSLPTLQRNRMAVNQAREYAVKAPATRGYQSESYNKLHSVGLASVSTAMLEPAAPTAGVDSATDRKMVRTGSVDLVVPEAGGGGGEDPHAGRRDGRVSG